MTIDSVAEQAGGSEKDQPVKGLMFMLFFHAYNFVFAELVPIKQNYLYQMPWKMAGYRQIMYISRRALAVTCRLKKLVAIDTR